MDHSLSHVAREAGSAAAGLQVFLEQIPGRDPRIAASIRELLDLESALRTLNGEWKYRIRYDEMPPTVVADTDLVLRSLHYTVGALQDMFGQTRFTTYKGARPFEAVWEATNSKFRADEGFSLSARLEMYSVLVKGFIEFLRG